MENAQLVRKWLINGYCNWTRIRLIKTDFVYKFENEVNTDLLYIYLANRIEQLVQLNQKDPTLKFYGREYVNQRLDEKSV